MGKEKYISAADAALLIGVTTQTIRNLCKAGTLSYVKRNKLFYPNRNDVERHAATIRDIQQATIGIEEYRQKIIEEWQVMANELRDMRTKYLERMQNLNMFPRRIEAIKTTLLAVVEGLKRYADMDDFDLSSRELEFVWDALQGKTFEEIGKAQHLTRERTRQIWYKALRKFAHVKGAFYHLNSEISDLKVLLKKKNDEIAHLHSIIEGKTITVSEETWKTSKILAKLMSDFPLSMRCQNVLRVAEIDTLRDLLRYRRAELIKFRNFGKKSLTELDELLEENGLTWEMDVNLYPEHIE